LRWASTAVNRLNMPRDRSAPQNWAKSGRRWAHFLTEQIVS
jgi:hypothetical protein